MRVKLPLTADFENERHLGRNSVVRRLLRDEQDIVFIRRAAEFFAPASPVQMEVSRSEKSRYTITEPSVQPRGAAIKAAERFEGN